jgi:protoheme IX farnesyltransferase
MSASSLVAVSPVRSIGLSRVFDYIELTKPRIAIMELVVVLAAGFVASWGQPQPWPLLGAMLGTLLVAGSASAANHWLERHRDARMARTANRPLPAGRLMSGEVLAFSAIGLIAGALQLALFVNVITAMWALLTWATYVLVYTPLKTTTVLNTAVGAVAGALPVFIGWSAVGGEFNSRAASLFMVLFLWQFPHFMAIAWLYRSDYAKAGHQMLSVVDPTGYSAGRQAVVAALVLIPISVLPVLAAPGLGPLLYVAGAVALGAGQLVLAALFFRRAGDEQARLLLRASLVYLPTLLAMLILAPWI